MKNQIIVTKRNNKKIINYDDIKTKNYYFYSNLQEIIKRILEKDKEINIIKKENNKYIVLEKDKEIYNFTIKDYNSHWKYIISINNENKTYNYDVIEKEDNFIIKLNSCHFIKNNAQYDINSFFNKLNVYIKENDLGINIVLGNILNLSQPLIDLISKINLNDNINEIYIKLEEQIKLIEDLKIRKFKVLNTIDSREINTELINIYKGQLIDYLATIEKEEKKYIVKKDRSNYSITLLNSQIDDLYLSYFELNDKIEFIKKLEKKK